MVWFKGEKKKEKKKSKNKGLVDKVKPTRPYQSLCISIRSACISN
jgi:hypothetical protein